MSARRDVGPGWRCSGHNERTAADTHANFALANRPEGAQGPFNEDPSDDPGLFYGTSSNAESFRDVT